MLGSVVMTQARKKNKEKKQPRNSVITPETTRTQLSFFLLSVTIAAAKLLGNAKLKMAVMPTGQHRVKIQ